MILKKLLNCVPIARSTFLKIVGFFLLSKFSIEKFGHDTFVTFSQVQQIALIVLTIATSFLQLAISKLYLNSLVFSKSVLVIKAIIKAFAISVLFTFFFLPFPIRNISSRLDSGRCGRRYIKISNA